MASNAGCPVSLCFIFLITIAVLFNFIFPLGYSGQQCSSLSSIAASSDTAIIDSPIVRPFRCGFWGTFLRLYRKHFYHLSHLPTSHIRSPQPASSYFIWTKILRNPVSSLRSYEQVFIWMGHKLPQLNVKTVWSLDHNFHRSGTRMLTFGDILFF